MLEKFIHIHKRKSDMGNKDNMKRKTTRKRSFRGRSSAVNNDAGKVRNEDAESGHTAVTRHCLCGSQVCPNLRDNRPHASILQIFKFFENLFQAFRNR